MKNALGWLLRYQSVFDTNFLGCEPTGPTSSMFMFISQMLSAIRADANVIFSKIVSPDEKLSAIDVNFEHCEYPNTERLVR